MKVGRVHLRLSSWHRYRYSPPTGLAHLGFPACISTISSASTAIIHTTRTFDAASTEQADEAECQGYEGSLLEDLAFGDGDAFFALGGVLLENLLVI